MILPADVRDNLRTWVDQFEDLVTEEGGPVSMAATFDSDAGIWSLVCSRDGGTKVYPPPGHGDAQDVEDFIAQHGPNGPDAGDHA